MLKAREAEDKYHKGKQCLCTTPQAFKNLMILLRLIRYRESTTIIEIDSISKLQYH